MIDMKDAQKKIKRSEKIAIKIAKIYDKEVEKGITQAEVAISIAIFIKLFSKVIEDEGLENAILRALSCGPSEDNFACAIENVFSVH